MIARCWYFILGGQFWVGGWYWGSPSCASFFREVCGLDLGDDMNGRAEAYADTAKSACWWWPHREFVMACERPRVIDRDASGRLHRETGAAVEFRDGWGVHAWHGVRVPAEVIEHPDTITVAQIEACTNAEIRRVMIERYGQARYLIDAGAREIQSDKFGTLYRKEIANDEPLVMVRLVNSTPEPDGSRKIYFQRVHPELRPLPPGEWSEQRQREWIAAQRPQKMTAHNAVASTFGLRGEEYAPDIET